MIKYIKIKDFASVITGGTPSTTKIEYWNGGTIPWLNSGELNQDIIISTKNYITQQGLDNSSSRLMPPDSVLIALTGSTTGVVGYLTFEACANQSVTGILPSNNHIPKYLYYYLKSIRKKIVSEAYGGAQPHISQGYVKDLEIPLPPLPQQQKIANILDAADELRQNDKALIAKYDELTQALFLDMFGDVRKNEKGWKQITLEKICDVGSSRRVFVDELVEEGVPFYRGTEIGQMSINENINPSLFITYVHYENLKKETGVPMIGDLLMPSICPDGRIFEVTNDNPFYFKDGRVLWIKVNKSNINSVYLKKHLKAIFAVDYSKIASGTTFAELKIFALKKLILHYPPIDLQNQYAERVAVIEEQKVIAQKSLEKSESLFNSLLQKAFKGELV